MGIGIRQISSTFLGVICILTGIILPFIPYLTALFGLVLWVIQALFIIGGSLNLIGLCVLNRSREWGQRLIFMSSIIGILNLPNLLILRFGASSEPALRSPKSTNWFLFFPVALSYFLLGIFIGECPDRAAIPLSDRGRNGLTLFETIWDTDVFWGEFWFNLLLILIISMIILVRFPPQRMDAMQISLTQERKILLGCIGISSGLLIAMGITWQGGFSITENWYSTQFAYQIPAWAPIIGLMGVMIFALPTAVKPKWNLVPGLCLLAFTGIWIYLTMITNFHPHALYHFGFTSYYVLSIFAYCMCIIVFFLQRLKIPQETRVIESKTRFIPWMGIFCGGLGLILYLQVRNAYTVPLMGADSMFQFDMPWSWGIAHWPTYVFDITSIGVIVFGSRMLYRKRAHVVTTKKHSTETAIHHHLPQIGTTICLAIIIGLPTIVIGTQWQQRDSPLLLVNQLGYYPNAPKRVLFQATNDTILPKNTSFEVVDSASGDVIYSDYLWRNLTVYDHAYMVGNFDTLTTNGTYFVRATVLNHLYQSPTFEIGENVYDLAIERALRFFYYQRCNYEVEEVVADYPGHAACHMDDAEVWNGTAWIQKDLKGGWHDAGDYNKYNSWFQTQWYCMQALAECTLLDPSQTYSSLPSLYDSQGKDSLDEALWGAKFLLNCVNLEGIQGENARYLVWETVSGYRHFADKEARMSYWGPPEMDWTTPRRVVFNSANSSFVGFHRGYDVAGALMQIARVIDQQKMIDPAFQFPAWAETNTTYLREVAGKVYARYNQTQANQADDIQSYIGKFYYQEELAIVNGKNWTIIDALITKIIPLIGEIESWPLWFGWAGYYMLGNILTHFFTHNRTIPAIVMQKINAIQSNHFMNLFNEPFRIKHGVVNGSNVLFYGAERQTDMMTSAWLQALFVKANATTAHPEIVQSYLDWLFGLNPTGTCLMESVGDRNIPQYHHRYSYARNPSGAVPGAIPNGIAQISASREYLAQYGLKPSDEAYLGILGDAGTIADWPGNPLYRDGAPSNPNEVWIPHNAMVLRLFTIIESQNLFR